MVHWDDDLRKLADVLKALGHPTRLRIIEKVQEGPFCVSELQRHLDQTQPNISQHLMILKDRGILVPERRGNLTCYHLADERIRELVKLAREIFHAPEDKRRPAKASVHK